MINSYDKVIKKLKYKDMNINDLLHRALQLESLSAEEGVFLFENAPMTDLMQVGHRLRKHHVL
jgi:cyclic dehypoxanthinyl futalosine synthase